MRVVGSHRRARIIGFALIAGFAAFESVLLLSAGAVGIPGLLLVRVAGSGDARIEQPTGPVDGGESVVAKLQPAPANETSEQTVAVEAADPPGEPTLQGLANIPMPDWIPEKTVAPELQIQTLAEAAQSGETLPWDAVEPVPFDTALPKVADASATAALPNRTMPDAQPVMPALAELPAERAVESWVKAKATELKGEHRARALYHFEFWLDAPEEVKRRLVAVAYHFNTPAVMPQSQISTEKANGFRVNAGGLVCADKVTVTLKFADGRTQQVAIDSCKLLG